MKKITFIMAIVSLLISSAHNALSDQTTTLNVTATAIDACTVAATPLDFGTFDGTEGTIQSLATVDVTCTSGLNFQVAFGGGLYTDFSTTPITRQMVDAEINTLPYQLFQTGGVDILGDSCLSSGGTYWDGACWSSSGTDSLDVVGEFYPSPASGGAVFNDTVTVTVIY